MVLSKKLSQGYNYSSTVTKGNNSPPLPVLSLISGSLGPLLTTSLDPKKILIKYDVSYSLSISSIAHKTRVDNIMSSCYISLDQWITLRNYGLIEPFD